MTHYVGLVEFYHFDTFYATQQLCGFQKTLLLVPWEVNLSEVSRDDELGVATHAGEEHFKLSGGGVLRFVEDHESVVEGSTSHEGERCYLDGAVFPVGEEFLLRNHVAQRVVEGLQVGVEFLSHVARKESQVLARFDSRAGEDDATYLLVLERTHSQSYGGLGLTCSSWAYGKHHVVVGDGLHQTTLVGCLSFHQIAVAPVYQYVVAELYLSVW